MDFTPDEALLIQTRQLGDTPFFAGPATLSVISRSTSDVAASSTHPLRRRAPWNLALDGAYRTSARTHEWVVVGLPYIIVYELDESAQEVAISLCFTAHKIAAETAESHRP